MTKEEFLTKLFELKGLVITEGFLERKLYIAILKSRYGYPTTAILEVEGSPPKMRIVVDVEHISNDMKSSENLDSYRLENTLFVFNSKSLSARSKKRKEMLLLIFRFLQSNSYLSDDENYKFGFYSM